MANAWDRRPDETDKSYRAFLVYLRLIDPTVPDRQSRSLAKVAEKMGYKSATMPEAWSAKFDWVSRASAYDTHMGSALVVMEEKALEEYQQSVVYRLTQQLTIFNDLIERTLKLKYDEINAGVPADPQDLKRIISAMRDADDLARRAGKMPTAFLREHVEDDAMDDMIFVVGTDDG